MPADTDNLTENENDVPSLAPWMKELPEIDPQQGAPDISFEGSRDAKPPAAAPAPPPKKEEEEAEPAPEPAAAPKPAPEAKAPAKAPEKPAAAPEKAKETTEEEEKWPRSAQDWEKFKRKRAERESALRKEISEREAKIADFQTKLKEAEEAKAAAAAKEPEGPPPELQKEIERLKKENEEYSKVIAVTEVTSHPKFKAYFERKVNEQLDIAKEIVGGEKAEEVAKLLTSPPSEFRTAKIEEIFNDLAPLQQIQFGPVLNALRLIDREREDAIAKAKEDQTKIAGERAEKQKAARTAGQKVFADVVKTMQDPKEGSPVYQFRKTADGQEDTDWNNGVKERIKLAESLLFGDGKMTQQELVRHTMNAAAFPTLLKAYQADVAEKDGQIEKLQAQVKALSAAQPVTGKSTEAAPGSDNSQPPSPKRNMNPFEISAQWAKSMNEGMGQ